jgi:uncharacterized protein YecE (DUF72 family)
VGKDEAVGSVRVGTCSWTDKTMISRWYPRGVSTAEARLRYYADRFDTVEVDSTFYALPSEHNSFVWAERTPTVFTFHIKAYGLMTGHAVSERALDPALREMEYRSDAAGRVWDPSREMVDASFELFSDALAPLRAAGKLGGVLMQFPPSFRAAQGDLARNLDYLEYAKERLGGDRMLVEFRHPSWVTEREDETMRFLSDRGIAYVSVDAPQFDDGCTMPPLARATADWGYVRMHGRNTGTYFARTRTAADRFDYLYGVDELAEWEEPVTRLAGETETTFVMFNSCKYDYAPRNAMQMSEILGDLVTGPGGKAGEGPTGRDTLF